MIIKKIWNRDGVKIFNVKEAMEQMKADGIKNVLVQPTHVINGIENDLMQEDVKAYADAFESISFGTPLLTTEEDNIRVAKAVAEDLQPEKKMHWCLWDTARAITPIPCMQPWITASKTWDMTTFSWEP